jgi:gamma-glutamylcyclotransferase (GGCT)/AIG2-like uncharacterized protein YtfP
VDYVFGYGSLTALAGARAQPAELHDHRRCWGVAADNRSAIPGYKRYRATDGSYPAVQVAFLDLVAGAGTVNGVCLPASPAQLAALDERERNYVRVEVTEQVADPLGRTWTYVGSPAGRARLAAGRTDGTAVVSREYRDIVLRGFARLGDDALARFHASSDLADLPVVDLERVDLAGRPAPRAG